MSTELPPLSLTYHSPVVDDTDAEARDRATLFVARICAAAQALLLVLVLSMLSSDHGRLQSSPTSIILPACLLIALIICALPATPDEQKHARPGNRQWWVAIALVLVVEIWRQYPLLRQFFSVISSIDGWYRLRHPIFLVGRTICPLLIVPLLQERSILVYRRRAGILALVAVAVVLIEPLISIASIWHRGFYSTQIPATIARTAGYGAAAILTAFAVRRPSVRLFAAAAGVGLITWLGSSIDDIYFVFHDQGGAEHGPLYVTYTCAWELVNAINLLAPFALLARASLPRRAEPAAISPAA